MPHEGYIWCTTQYFPNSEFFKEKILCSLNSVNLYHYFREGSGILLQYSCLEDPMDGGAWWAAVHGVAKSQTRLSDFTFTFHFQALEKEMATHSSVLAWRIPEMGEPGGLPSMGSHRVVHDWSDLAAAAAARGCCALRYFYRVARNPVFNVMSDFLNNSHNY